MAKSFRELEVWQVSMDISVLVYRLTSRFPNHEQYGLIAQMRRAAVSIASNIAEVAGRDSRRDLRQFVIMARGSTCELQTQLLLSCRLGYCQSSEIEDLQLRADQVGRMLNGFATYLKAKSTTQTTRNHQR